MMDATEVRARISALGGTDAYISADRFRTLHGHAEYEVSYVIGEGRAFGTGDSWAAAMASAESNQIFVPTVEQIDAAAGDWV